MKIPLYCLLFIISVVAVADDALVVLIKGNTIVASGYSVKGNSVIVTTSGGETKEIPKRNIFEILVRAKRTTEYTPRETRERIAAVNRVFREFPDLKKQLQMLLDEWLSIRKQYEELSPEKVAELRKEIQDTFRTYELSMRDEAAYARLRQEMEMIRYRDLRGIFENDIQQKLHKYGSKLIGEMAEVIEKQIQTKKISVDEYTKIRSTVRRLMTYYPPLEIRLALRELEQDAGYTCLKGELKASWKRFSDNRGITAYLRENTALKSSAKQFSHLPECAKKIDRLRTRMKDALAFYYDFNTKAFPGFPLSKNDKKRLKKAHEFCSSTTEPVANPIAILFPLNAGNRIKLSPKKIVVIQAILSEAPKEGLRLFIKPYNTVMKIKTPLKDNGLEIRFSTGLLTHMVDAAEKGKRSRKIDVFLAEGKENKPLSNPISFQIRR